MNKKIRILIAGEPASIHTGKFTTLLQSLGYEVRIFQSTYHPAQEEHLKKTTIYCDFPYTKPNQRNEFISFYPFNYSTQSLLFKLPFFRLPIRWLHQGLERLFGRRPRSLDLIQVIHTWKPDLIISLKMQDDGYMVSEAKQFLGEIFTPKWIHFSWGTDMELYGKHSKFKSEHLPRIKQLLSSCDFLMADCQRDLDQANKFGFRGQKLGVMVGNGGHNLKTLADFRRKNLVRQKTILIKGRNDQLVGKSINIIKALNLIKPILADYTIKILLGDTLKNDPEFKKLNQDIKCHFITYLPYKSILHLFAQSQIAISATTVDGTPNFLTEAMCLGAFPIHSDMSSVREWITDGVNGLLFPVDDVKLLSHQIARAITDQNFRDQASKQNWQIAKKRINKYYNAKVIQKIITKVLQS